jgi:hypothetical protein
MNGPSKIFAPVVLAFLALVTGVVAKDTKKIPPPVAPLVASVPENADWTVTAKDSSQEKGKKGRGSIPAWFATEVRSTKRGAMKRDLVKSGDGTTREVWFVDKLRIWTTDSGEISVSDLGAAPAPDSADPYPSVATVFPGVSWITLENFVGAEDFNGEPCYHFVNDYGEAWISVKTKFPAGYKSGTMFYIYKFNAPPGEDFKMPPAYQKALETVNEMRRQPSPQE